MVTCNLTIERQSNKTSQNQMSPRQCHSGGSHCWGKLLVIRSSYNNESHWKKLAIQKDWLTVAHDRRMLSELLVFRGGPKHSLGMSFGGQQRSHRRKPVGWLHRSQCMPQNQLGVLHYVQLLHVKAGSCVRNFHSAQKITCFFHGKTTAPKGTPYGAERHWYPTFCL